VRVALDLKKTLVEKEKFEVSQSAMEEELFQLLSSYGYGEETVQLYQTLSRSVLDSSLSAATDFPAATHSVNLLMHFFFYFWTFLIAGFTISEYPWQF
jgi:hypothetical protein